MTILNLFMALIGYSITTIFLVVAIQEAIVFYKRKQWYNKRRRHGLSNTV